MRRAWILTAVGKDQPGIVACVTKMLYQLGCNLEDSAMTRLAGEFAIMLIFSADGSLSQRALERACGPLPRDLKLAVHLKALAHSEITQASRGRPYLISVYGADRPGIVFRVSEALARQRVNITDVSTHRTAPARAERSEAGGGEAGKRTKSLYLMLLEVELPRALTVRALSQRLQRLARRLGVEVTVRSAEAHVL